MQLKPSKTGGTGILPAELNPVGSKRTTSSDGGMTFEINVKKGLRNQYMNIQGGSNS